VSASDPDFGSGCIRESGEASLVSSERFSLFENLHPATLPTIAEPSVEMSGALAYILVVALLPENSTPQRLSRCARTNLSLLQSSEEESNEEEDPKCSGQAARNDSRSGERSRILPRLLSIAPFRCHSLRRRLAVNTVTLASLAKSSFVTSS
jgi:hypothetical protein